MAASKVTFAVCPDCGMHTITGFCQRLDGSKIGVCIVCKTWKNAIPEVLA